MFNKGRLSHELLPEFFQPFFPRSAARRGFREQIFGIAQESASTVGGGPWLTILELFRRVRSSQAFRKLDSFNDAVCAIVYSVGHRPPMRKA
jgi:hypothetical protein